MKRKKQSKKKRANGGRIALIVIALFLVVAIVGVMLWLSDLGSNWDVRTWGDKFKSEQQGTKPNDVGNKKPVIAVITEPTLFDAIEVGDEMKAMYIDIDYVITDEDIARFKSEGKAVEEDGQISYYLIYEKYREYSPFGLRYIEIDSAMLKAILDGSEYNADDISDDAAVRCLSFSYEGGGGLIWVETSGYISDEVFKWLWGDDEVILGWSASEHVCSPTPIHVQEVYCADVLRKFIEIKSEAEYEQNQ